MKIKVFILIVALTSLNAYSANHDNAGIKSFVNYIMKNNAKNKPAISYIEKELFIFEYLDNVDNMFDEKGVRNDVIKHISEEIRDITTKKHCAQEPIKIIMNLIETNKNKKIIQVKYPNGVFLYQYSIPLQVTDCNLIIVFEEYEAQHGFPRPGAISLQVFEFNNSNDELKPLLSKELMHFD